jgi:acyl-CoA hydrolase
MEVGVRAECEPAHGANTFVAARAYLTFVAINERGTPIAVPPIVPETPDEQRRFQQAEQRRQERLKTRSS